MRRSQSASATVKPLVAGEVARRGVWCELSQLAPEKAHAFCARRGLVFPAELFAGEADRDDQGSPHLWQMFISDFSRAAAAAETPCRGRGLVTVERPKSGPKGPASRGKFSLFLIPYGGEPLSAYGIILFRTPAFCGQTEFFSNLFYPRFGDLEFRREFFR